MDVRSEHSVGQHGIGNLQESGDVGSCLQVSVILLGGLHTAHFNSRLLADVRNAQWLSMTLTWQTAWQVMPGKEMHQSGPFMLN